MLLFFATMACGQAEPAATQTTSSPSQAACRLPIAISDSQYHLHGGFLDYPGGKVTMDSAGDGGAYYDRKFSRWLPVGAKAIDANGMHFAYLDRKVAGTSAPEILHVVDVAKNNDHSYDLGPNGDPAAYVVVAFAPEGIWLSFGGYEGPGGGLFLFDLNTGSLKNVSGTQEFDEPVAAGHGAFWFTDAGPHPQVEAGMGFGIPAQIQRFTVADGRSEEWFTKDGAYVRVLGTDLAGHPIFTDGTDILLATAPDQTHVIVQHQNIYAVFVDGHGIWLGGQTGIYLYTTAGDLVMVSDQAGSPVGSCA